MALKARRQLVAFWDQHVAHWLAGADPMTDPLLRWYASYPGSGPGRVTRDGFVEPYSAGRMCSASNTRRDLWSWGSTPATSTHRIRPGPASSLPRSGTDTGPSAPGHEAAPTTETPGRPPTGPIATRSRRHFARVWLSDPSATLNDLLIVELYPWHSARVTAAMRPPADLLDQFIWKPLSELRVAHYFAFGRPWQRAAEAIGLRRVAALGAGGTPYGSTVPSRAVRIYKTPSDHTLVVEWPAGGAGPPRADEVEILRRAIASR